MKAILEVEIERPSKVPTVFKEEPAEIPAGLSVEIVATDDDSLWGGAVWRGRVISSKVKKD